jgi:putative ABC transport system permease protein
MLRNYLKTAFRFLKKNKAFSFINIIGLAIGTLCCLYILLYVGEQYHYDQHHLQAKDIYRVTSLMKVPGANQRNTATISPPVGPAMRNDFSEVLQYTRVVPAIGINQHLLRYHEKSFYQKEGVFVDSTFFDIFTYHFTNGTAKDALAAPYSVVLLKPTADKLFGQEDPIGKVIEIDNAYGKHDFRVTAVVDESLGKSHIHANMFFTMNSGGMGDYTRNNEVWAGNNFTATYVKLHPDANPAALEKKLPAFLMKYGQQELQKMGVEKEMHLQPMASIHHTKDYENETDKTVSPAFLYLLVLIAALIQLIACINFMNLSTARASKRAKEVGVRKVVGAGKLDLIKQFLSESFLLSLIGVLIAVPLLLLALPYLNQLTQADIHLSLLRDYRVWGMLAGLVVITGLVAGSYPAFYLSALQAVRVMKGNFSNQVSAAGLRRSLVVFQFVLSIGLITGVIIIYQQLNYIKQKDLGFEKTQKLVFTFHTNEAISKMTAFMDEIKQLPEVKAISRANNYPSRFVFNDAGFYLGGGNMANSQSIQFMLTDEHFAAATGIRLLSGRNFHLHDSASVLVNETMARKMGLDPLTAPGTRLYSQYGSDPANSFQIAGVMKDFNYNSLHESVKPFMFIYSDDAAQLSNLIVNTSSTNYKTLVSKMEIAWHKYLPATPFEYLFLDDEVQKLYETEITLARIINSFTLMAILISCLGLFGLAAFSAEQRKKEIGIRKVLGASVTGIVQLLSKDFLKLVAVAIAIATPISWWAMSKWLDAFAYRVSMSWWMFVIAGALAIIIALFTVSFQAIKAALVNPVKSLQSE